MAGPFDIDDEMQRKVLRKGEAAAKSGHVFQRLLQLAESRGMLLCLDALHWGQSDLHRMVPDGDRQVLAVIDLGGLKWTEAQ